LAGPQVQAESGMAGQRRIALVRVVQAREVGRVAAHQQGCARAHQDVALHAQAGMARSGLVVQREHGEQGRARAEREIAVDDRGPRVDLACPLTTTLPLNVPVSTPGAFGVPEQVAVPPVTAAPAAVTGPAASIPPMTALVNTRQDKPRRYALMTPLPPMSRPGT